MKGYLNNPQSQNPYSYSLNNPINLSDPSGEDVYNQSGQYIVIKEENEKVDTYSVVAPKGEYIGPQDGVIFNNGVIYKNNSGPVNLTVTSTGSVKPAGLVSAVVNSAGDLGKTVYNAIPVLSNKDLSGWYSLNDGSATGNWRPNFCW